MMNTMHALVKGSAAPGMTLDTVPVPECGRDDVLIRVQRTGICGTDVHIFSWDQWAQNRIHPPLVVGHEFMGVVEAVGEAVSDFRPGDIVSGEGHIGCGHCYFCRTGQGHICRKVEIIGVDRAGCFANFIALPQSNVWKVKQGVPLDAAAIFDPLGNAMHTVMAQPVAGRSVAIIGAGAIGLMACRIARAAGALSVIAVEPNAAKRKLSLAMGAERAIDPTADGWVEELLHASSDGVGVDVVLEISGNATAIRSAFQIARPGGEVALLGIPPSEVSLNLSTSIIFKGITVRGINGRLMYETWYQCERFLMEQKVDLEPIITHRFPYSRYQEAFDLLLRGEAVKIILDWQDNGR